MTFITNIKTHSKDPNFRDVIIDDTETYTILNSTLTELGLHVGQEWSDSIHSKIEIAESSRKANSIALQLISRKAWGVNELAERLVKRGICEEVAQQTTQQLAKDGWLDDRAYASARIREWTRKEPASRKWLIHKLLERKLSREKALTAIEEELGDISEQELADKLAIIRLKKLDSHDENTIRRRMMSALGRRGFSSDVGAEAIRHAQDASS